MWVSGYVDEKGNVGDKGFVDGICGWEGDMVVGGDMLMRMDI